MSTFYLVLRDDDGVLVFAVSLNSKLLLASSGLTVATRSDASSSRYLLGKGVVPFFLAADRLAYLKTNLVFAFGHAISAGAAFERK